MDKKPGPRWLSKLTHSSDTPRRTAAAFSLGVFLSFSPFFGLQIAMGLAVAFALRLSRVAVLVGVCTNLPWIMVPWYTLATAAGAVALGVPVAADLQARFARLLQLPFYGAAFWQHALDLVRPFFWAFLVGSIAGALIVSALAYVVVAPLLEAVHARRASTRS